MTSTNRIDGFEGDVLEYVHYLEELVTSHRTQDPGRTSAQGTQHEGGTAKASALCRGRDRPWPDGHQQSPATDGLIVIQWTAPPTKSLSCNPTWMKKVRVLVDSAPEASDWRRVVQEAGIYDVMGTGSAATFLLDNKCPPPESLGSRPVVPLSSLEASTTVLYRLEAYAHSAVRREKTASVALMLAIFQKFLLLSACAVTYHGSSDRAL